MAKSAVARNKPPAANNDALRQPAEVEYAVELKALAEHDDDDRPEGWHLSPKAVRTYITGGKVGGVTIPAGNQVVLMYSSANRDEAHFDDPESLDVTRTPNNHISFGFGTHFCLGASLARLEIKVFFEELLRRTKGWELTPGTEPAWMPNAFVRGIEMGLISPEEPA